MKWFCYRHPRSKRNKSDADDCTKTYNKASSEWMIFFSARTTAQIHTLCIASVPWHHRLEQSACHRVHILRTVRKDPTAVSSIITGSPTYSLKVGSRTQNSSNKQIADLLIEDCSMVVLSTYRHSPRVEVARTRGKR